MPATLNGWWKLDKLNAAGKVPEASGNGLDGTPTNITFTNGRASFNGINSVIRLPLYPTINFGVDAHTITFRWKTPTSFDAYNQLFFGYLHRINYSRYKLYYQPGVGICYRLESAGDYFIADCVLSTNTTYHIVVASTSGYQAIILDGVLLGEWDRVYSDINNIDLPVSLGADLDTGDSQSGYGAGQFGDLRVYGGILSQAKIEAVYHDRKGRPYPWQHKIVEPTVEEVVHYG